MSINCLDFEQPIIELESKIQELRLLSSDNTFDINDEIKKLQQKSKALTQSIFKKLSDWQVVQLARHPLRPYSLDYIQKVFTDFDELHGDRSYADDKAIVGGLARLEGKPVMVIGQQKGRDTKEKIARNFGMAHPEGYRKALRLALLAEKFRLPIITMIDTPGAYPGIGAEARGQSEAIAKNLFMFAKIKVPIICVIIGEGCSGGALGIGVGDRVLMLQYAYYATISPEGCATILWKSASKAPDAVETMCVTANKLIKLGLIDAIVPEPPGGAHRDYLQMAEILKTTLASQIKELSLLSQDQRLKSRYQKMMNIGR